MYDAMYRIPGVYTKKYIIKNISRRDKKRNVCAVVQYTRNTLGFYSSTHTTRYKILGTMYVIYSVAGVPG